MKRQDLLTILITFCMGVIFGFYIYLAGFAPANERITTALETNVDGLVITGEAYGGCIQVGNCPRFNIASDGSYRYFYTPLGTGLKGSGTFLCRLKGSGTFLWSPLSSDCAF
jgi:hypothetical protein